MFTSDRAHVVLFEDNLQYDDAGLHIVRIRSAIPWDSRRPDSRFSV
jgi:hypothetical protein